MQREIGNAAGIRLVKPTMSSIAQSTHQIPLLQADIPNFPLFHIGFITA